MSIWSRISDVAQGIGGSVLQVLSGGKTAPEKSIAFTIAMIALGAKMAKADGVVTEDEVAAFRQVFKVPEKDMAAVTRVFNLAKGDTAGFESYAKQVAGLFPKKDQMLENVLDGLFHIAKADGAVHEDELAFLESVAKHLGFEKADFIRIRAGHVVIEDDPYVVLGLPAHASLAEVKARYKKLARELHPDKQMAKGMPKELIVIATERLARINAAYALITKGAPA